MPFTAPKAPLAPTFATFLPARARSLLAIFEIFCLIALSLPNRLLSFSCKENPALVSLNNLPSSLAFQLINFLVFSNNFFSSAICFSMASPARSSASAFSFSISACFSSSLVACSNIGFKVFNARICWLIAILLSDINFNCFLRSSSDNCVLVFIASFFASNISSSFLNNLFLSSTVFLNSFSTFNVFLADFLAVSYAFVNFSACCSSASNACLKDCLSASFSGCSDSLSSILY